MIPADFQHALDLLDAGDAAGLAAHLAAHPGLARQRVDYADEGYFRSPALLDFVAENPARRGQLPPAIVDVATAILEAGAWEDPAIVNSALGLVASGRVARESGVQTALIDLLCDRGADPNCALLPALAHGEFAAAQALVRRGAAATLGYAAATGRADDARALLEAASADERHTALALAAQHGHAEIVALLLDAGEDPNRFNPPGAHAHATPLHQAAGAGHEAVVRLLAERGARLDMIDAQYGGTPRGWAQYAGHEVVAAYLSER